MLSTIIWKRWLNASEITDFFSVTIVSYIHVFLCIHVHPSPSLLPSLVKCRFSATQFIFPSTVFTHFFHLLNALLLFSAALTRRSSQSSLVQLAHLLFCCLLSSAALVSVSTFSFYPPHSLSFRFLSVSLAFSFVFFCLFVLSMRPSTVSLLFLFLLFFCSLPFLRFFLFSVLPPSNKISTPFVCLFFHYIDRSHFFFFIHFLHFYIVLLPFMLHWFLFTSLRLRLIFFLPLSMVLLVSFNFSSVTLIFQDIFSYLSFTSISFCCLLCCTGFLFTSFRLLLIFFLLLSMVLLVSFNFSSVTLIFQDIFSYLSFTSISFCFLLCCTGFYSLLFVCA
ncbi:uncharacterized protein LOC126997889 [Eriocheir sinensis]|uniref:uncharacterized protein LOC126997889 n=1 Tax=Eriocheir sinensis TaxID=95602 RepID=UPI0021C663B9|nr:uncharacterized protein LOC126997889 [Eriocheir sinensis]